MNVKFNLYVSGKKISYGEIPENVALGVINATLITLNRDDDAELVGYCVDRWPDVDAINLQLEFSGTTELEKERNMAIATSAILHKIIELVCFLSAD